MRTPGTPVATSLMAVSAVALWGLAFPLIQEGLEDFSPVVLGFLRFLTASAVMAAVMLYLHPAGEIASVFRREWRPLLALGALYVSVPNVLQNIGLQHGTSSVASVIQSSGPVLTLIFAVVLLREGMTVVKGIGSGVAMAGTVLLVVGDGASLGDEDFVANVVILASAASYALAWVSAKRMLERSPPMLIIGLSVILGTLILGAAAPFEADARWEFGTESIANLLVLGALCGAGSSVLYLHALEKEEVSKMAFFIYLMPVFASLFAWSLRGEVIAVWTGVCGLVIIAGIAISQRTPRSS